MDGPHNYGRVSTCAHEEWFKPAFPNSANVGELLKDNGLLDGTKLKEFNVPYAADGQAPQTIPEWCSQECKDDWRQCPRPFRLDHYDCNPYVTR